MLSFKPDPTLPKPTIAGRRSVPRVRLFVPAQVMLVRGLEQCVLDNLSQHGAQILFNARMPQDGSGAVLKVKDLDVFGTVIWVKGKHFGVQFEEAVTLQQVVQIRHYADAYAEHQAMINARNARNFVQGRAPGRRLR